MPTHRATIWRHISCVIALSFLLYFSLSTTSAQQAKVTAAQLMEGKQMRQNADTHISSKLHVLVAYFQQEQGKDITAIIHPAELQQQINLADFMFNQLGHICVSIRANDWENIISPLEAMGFGQTGISEKYNIIEGYIPVDQILNLESLVSSGLLSVLPVYKPELDSGSVGSQADTVHQTYRVRGIGPNNYDGTGVNIGVLSDSYDMIGGGAAAGIGSGDLPAGGVNVIQDGSPGNSDEGRAMLELIHDMAPGATLHFATANGGETAFSTNIQALADAGCTVIVDDITYLTEPFYQDGVIAQKVNEVTNDEDVIYFASAGNRDTSAYENTSPTFAIDGISGLNALDFDPTAAVDHYQQFIVPDGGQLRLAFQWKDPWFNLMVDSDMDIFIYDNPAVNILASSTNNNLLFQVPWEIVTYNEPADGTDDTVNVLITLGGGSPNPGRLKYVNFGSHLPQEYGTASPTVNPHGGAEKCVSVAASLFYAADFPELFTSHGPNTFLFDVGGTELGAPLVRQTPIITAVDRVNNTFFGTDTGFDPDAFPNFSGTSAAAPNAAAIAAIFRQANPASNRDAILNLLINNAKDIGAAGFDNITGNGLVNAFSPLFTVTPASLDFTDGFETGTFSNAWELTSSITGRIIPNSLSGPATGTYHMTLDTWAGFTTIFNLNEAILHFDATGFSNITLSFDQKESGDEDNSMSVTFSGSENSDGVALSVDGTNWYRLFDLTGLNSTTTYANKSINLSTFATTNTLTLGSDVRIKFQQYDNFPFSSDGIAFDNISVSGTSLPITLVSFEGKNQDNKAILLNWKTDQEINNDFFTLERSADGTNFKALTKVKGAGTSELPHTYQYIDQSPVIGTNYYRLRQTDFDGSETLSNAIAIEFDGLNYASIFPNPLVSDHLDLQYSSDEDGELTVSIIDAKGRTVSREMLPLTAGKNKFSINVESLAKGVYVLKCNHSGFVKHIQFVNP